MSQAKSILQVPSLQSYFYENLSELNKKSLCPLPEETIYYSSSVLDRYSLTGEFFQKENGRVQEKVLGSKLLEAGLKNSEEQRRIYRDVGDMSLMVCGYFSDSINKKILDINYYVQLGQIAYQRLDSLDVRFYDMPAFYKIMATSFANITRLISLLAEQNQLTHNKNLLIDECAEEELWIRGITPNSSKKVS